MTSKSSLSWNGKGIRSPIDESESLRWKRHCNGFDGEDKDESGSAESHTAYRSGLSASRFLALPQDALQDNERGISNDQKLSLEECFDLVKGSNAASNDHTSEAWFHDYGQDAAVSGVGISGTATPRDIRRYGYQSEDVKKFKICLGLVS